MAAGEELSSRAQQQQVGGEERAWRENAWRGGSGGRRPGFEGAMAQRSEAVVEEVVRLWELEARAQGCSLLSPRFIDPGQAVSGFQASYFWPKRSAAHCTADCSAVREINNFICLERARRKQPSVRCWPLRCDRGFICCREISAAALRPQPRFTQ